MDMPSKLQVVTLNRYDERNDSSSSRKRFLRFSYVFGSTFVGFVLLDRIKFDSGVEMDNRSNSCLRVRVML
jgi:hypothetical protein